MTFGKIELLIIVMGFDIAFVFVAVEISKMIIRKDFKKFNHRR